MVVGSKCAQIAEDSLAQDGQVSVKELETLGCKCERVTSVEAEKHTKLGHLVLQCTLNDCAMHITFDWSDPEIRASLGLDREEVVLKGIRPDPIAHRRKPVRKGTIVERLIGQVSIP